MQAVGVARAGLTPIYLGNRVVSALFVCVALVALEGHQLLTLLVVMGQGHFLAAYFYQAKAGQLGRRTLIAWPIAAVALFTGYLLYPNFWLLVLIASVYFVVHFLQDEVFLLNERPTRERGLDLLPLILLFGAFLVGLGYVQIDAGATLAYPTLAYPGRFGGGVTRLLVAAAIVALAANAGLVLAGRLPWRRSSLYFHAGSAALLALYFSGVPLLLEQLMGSAILFHYANWYVHYAVKYSGDRPKLARYLRDMLAANAIVLVLYWFTGRHADVPFPVGLLFAPHCFYLWTILHIAFSSRLADLDFWLAPPPQES